MATPELSTADAAAPHVVPLRAAGLRAARLRPARPADMQALRTLHRRALQTLGPLHYTPAQIASFLHHVPTLDPALIDAGSYFVIEVDGALAACGGYGLQPPAYGAVVDLGAPHGDADGEPPALIRGMYTDPHWARCGFGRRILAAAEDALRAAGRRRVTLDALLPGVPLYRSAGFVAGAAVRARLPDGEALTIVPMAKPLGAGGRP